MRYETNFLENCNRSQLPEYSRNENVWPEILMQMILMGLSSVIDPKKLIFLKLLSLTFLDYGINVIFKNLKAYFVRKKIYIFFMIHNMCTQII